MAEKAKKKFSLLRVLLAVIIGILAIIIIGLIIVFFPRSKIENVPSLEKSGAKSLVVYFSRDKVIDTDGVDATSSASLNIGGREYVGDVTDAAEKVAKATGSDIYQIHTERCYPQSYGGTAMRAFVEEKLNMRPDLANIPDDLDGYDVIYVGYPIWWFNAPMPVGTFLESYDLNGKTIVPFCTAATDSIDETMPFIREVCKGADVRDGLTATNKTYEEIESWLQDKGLI